MVIRDVKGIYKWDKKNKLNFNDRGRCQVFIIEI